MHLLFSVGILAKTLQLLYSALVFSFNPTMQHSMRQYGACTPRTQCERPPNNTPLMMFCEGRVPVCTNRTVLQMLSDNTDGRHVLHQPCRGRCANLPPGHERRLA